MRRRLSQCAARQLKSPLRAGYASAFAMRLLLCCGIVVTVLACRVGEGVVPDSGAPPPGCPVVFTHRALSSASTVSVIGEWNQYDRLAQGLQEVSGSGTWAGTFNVPPGTWTYAYLENGAEVSD